MQLEWTSDRESDAAASAEQIDRSADDVLLDAYSAAVVRAVEIASPSVVHVRAEFPARRGHVPTPGADQVSCSHRMDLS